MFPYLLFSAVLSLPRCGCFSVFAASEELPFAAVRGLLALGPSLGHTGCRQTRGLQWLRFPGPRAQAQRSWLGAQVFCSMWDLARPGSEPVSPALTSRFFTTEPPGKPSLNNFNSPSKPCHLGKAFLLIFLIFMQCWEVTFYLQLLQNLDYIPQVVQHILALFLHSRVCAFHSRTLIWPFPTGNH